VHELIKGVLKDRPLMLAAHGNQLEARGAQRRANCLSWLVALEA
jgi:hypothetical protein